MEIYSDQRIVMTLDAGGTNFVFSALKAGKEVVEPVSRPAITNDRDKSLKHIIDGFRAVKSQLAKPPAAISFAFPGPADYPNGIIYNVGNLPAFSGGVALGPMLENQFDIPVFINNDGDLFAYGEAMAGLLPEINQQLLQHNVPKQYKNLFGVTVGTGFGGGLVIDGALSTGDNSASAEIWLARNFSDTGRTAEEGVSIRAVQKAYKELDPDTEEILSPKQIYDIAKGKREGNQSAAREAFARMGRVLGEALANAITLIDGAMVIGGGISGAWELFMPTALDQLNGTIGGAGDKSFDRLVSTVYNLEDPGQGKDFYEFENSTIEVPFSDKKVPYVNQKRLPIGRSRLGTSEATALGAYAFALSKL